MSHEWTMKFIEHRVADRRMLRLIQKWLKAGVSEDGQWSETIVGTPQGAVVSPLLANVYLHTSSTCSPIGVDVAAAGPAAAVPGAGGMDPQRDVKSH